MSIDKITSAANMFPQITRLDSGKEVSGLAESPKTGGLSQFGNMVSEGIGKVNHQVTDFENISKQFANGEQVNVHEMMLKGEQAEMGMRLMLSLRNKIVDAYQDIMRLPV